MQSQELNNENESSLKPSNWNSHYIYGFINGNPMQKISDKEAVSEIIRNTAGLQGFIGIDSIFHPYYLVNEKGATAWDLAWFSIYLKDQKAITEIANNETAIVVESENLGLEEFRIWPNDSVDPNKYEQYQKFVPFILPYLTYSENEESTPHWAKMVNAEIELQGHAETYIENFNNVFSQFVTGHIMTLGFGTFDRENPDSLIEKFTSFYEENIANR
ncbi:hypothetical protein CEY12_09010 [Chryseobacterium sp. T16E-39]|uniref:hypothetical protein n=1 Tax=Chryseobacterium sp. T16E-39 TaxID=2015076 RepID=UPI000B5B0D12|nr:hypothetical protein [Chryseobacterium sp. T16E-39]ASK30244.1 hypothetical protein CEY12_09010 [Chryseobacterium sp. T16E-39]